MKPVLAILIVLPFAACSPSLEVIHPAPERENDWHVRFERAHGTRYDPLSRLDRQKMAELKGEADTRSSPTTTEVREQVLTVARPLIGQTETHGSNRSPLIDRMNQLTGVPLGSPYCASFNAWCYHQAGAPGEWPKSAWSPEWVKSPTWTAAKGGTPPQPADAFGIWFASKGRIAHTGLIESWGRTSAITIEANTSPSAEFGTASDRDGDGIWRKRRMRSQIHSTRNWIKD